VTSVVEEDDVSALNFFGDFLFNFCCWRAVPVVAGNVPHNGFEAEFADDTKNGRTAAAERRTEKIGVRAHGVFDCGAAVEEFAADFFLAFENQQRMREGVVADEVTRIGNSTCDIGTLLHVAANQKKSCVNVVPSEDIEKMVSVRIVGAVVVGKNELARVARVSGKCFSVPLAGGRHGLIAGGDCSGGDYECAGNGRNHDGILLDATDDFRFAIQGETVFRSA
jgi:hypothetical protein